MDFLTVERDPNKRRVKPVETQASILDFDLEEESSDDSDFRIEDHPEVSDDDDDSGKSNDEGKAKFVQKWADCWFGLSDDHSTEEEESEGSDLDELKNLNLPNGDGLSVTDVIQRANLQLSAVSFVAQKHAPELPHHYWFWDILFMVALRTTHVLLIFFQYL